MDGRTPKDRAPSIAALEAIRDHAVSIGFDRLGVAASQPPPQAALYEDWLRRGLHGEMTYLVRGAARRLDPSLLLRDVRSVLVGALRYGPQPAPGPSPLSGEVSCYAWGEDYHLVLGAKAAALAAFIRKEYDARAAEYVDTGPVLERMWAAKAGVGWIGKNALVLNTEIGSFFFLAVILTDLDLPPDGPAPDQCGACSLCIEACPTGAIVEPRVVDSRLCLSYQTIELRGVPPEKHRGEAGTRVFGCDDCQTVCPWNRGEAPVPEEFHPRQGRARPDLSELLTMTLPRYTEWFRESAMKRASYSGLRRNAAIALGNLLAGRPTVSDVDRRRGIAALEEASSDADPGVADAARWGLRRSVRGATGSGMASPPDLW